MTAQTVSPPSPRERESTPATAARKPWYKAEFSIGRQVKLEEVMNFSRQAASFLRAGVPILDSLAVVGEENASKKMQSVLAQMQQRLRAGSSFGDAVAQHPRIFPGYYIAVVRASELTGRLDEALEQLSEYIERDVETRRKVQERTHLPDHRLLPRDRGRRHHVACTCCRSSSRSTRGSVRSSRSPRGC